jgi:OmpA-OmpF porin, OOP family
LASWLPDANMALSQTRADAVRDYLVNAGIDSSRIEVNAYGDTKLKYGRTDPRNRRVSIQPKP